MSLTLFDDVFVVSEVDRGNYDKVLRITARLKSSQETHLTLDINHDLFPVKTGESLTVALASQLSDTPTNSASGWRPPKPDEHSLADDYDYVMYGTIYKFTEGKEDTVTVYVSFGGLLLCLEGPYRSLLSLKQEHVYLLMRR